MEGGVSGTDYGTYGMESRAGCTLKTASGSSTRCTGEETRSDFRRVIRTTKPG